jgi:hypothetical protein
MQGSRLKLSRSCTEETTLEGRNRNIHIKVDGLEIPVGKFVQGFLVNTIIGMLSSLKKVDIKEDSLVEIKLRYKR